MKNFSSDRKTWPQAKFIYCLLTLFAFIYIYLIYKNALLFESHSHSALKLFIINISLAIPELIIWAVAFSSSARLKQYAFTINHTKDGEGINYLADALLVMSLYVVLISTYSIIVGMFKNSGNLNTIVSVENFAPLAVALASSIILFLGSLKLNKIVPLKIRLRTRLYFIVLFILFVAPFIARFYMMEATLLPQNGIPHFVLPTKVLLFTYVLPHVIMWALGLSACLNIANYSIHTKGAIYRGLFSNLYKGVVLVFIATYFAQLLIISNLSFNKFSVGLVLVYGILVLGAYGFVLTYKGSQNLNKLEKV